MHAPARSCACRPPQIRQPVTSRTALGVCHRSCPGPVRRLLCAMCARILHEERTCRPSPACPHTTDHDCHRKRGGSDNDRASIRADHFRAGVAAVPVAGRSKANPEYLLAELSVGAARSPAQPRVLRPCRSRSSPKQGRTMSSSASPAGRPAAIIRTFSKSQVNPGE